MSDSSDPSPHRRFSTLAVIAAVGVVGIAIWLLAGGLFRPDDKAPVGNEVEAREYSTGPASYTPPPTGGYIGSAACADCHRQLFDSYSAHPMYNSTLRITDDSPSTSELGTAQLAGEQRVLQVDNRPDGMTHHELMYDADGELIYDDTFEMDYIIGSGRRGSSFMQFREGLMFISPITRYADTQAWGLNPGYVADDPRRFHRRATSSCLNCHAGRPAPVERNVDRYHAEPYVELAIGCERCHGPGLAHVELHEVGAQPDDVDPIVNPAELDHARQESVCYQCHLQTSTDRVLRYGRSSHDFRPGDLFEDIWTVFETDSGVSADGRTVQVRHVQQMRASRCYQESGQQMTCTSCHDPHRIPSPAERVDFFRQSCLKCHSEQACRAPSEERAAIDDSCFQCHMPRMEMRSTAHASQTDHRVLSRADLPAGGRDSGGGTRFFDNQDQRLNEAERDRAYVLGRVTDSVSRGGILPTSLESQLKGLSQVFPGDGPLLMAYGTYSLSRANFDQAVRCYTQAADIPATAETALKLLIDISDAQGQWQSCVEHCDRLLALNPFSAPTYAAKATALLELGSVDEAIASAVQAVEHNRSLVEYQELLRDCYQRKGDDASQNAVEAVIDRMRTARPPQSSVAEEPGAN